MSQANVYINLLSQPTNCSDYIYLFSRLPLLLSDLHGKEGRRSAWYPYLHVCEEVNVRCSERLKKAP